MKTIKLTITLFLFQLLMYAQAPDIIFQNNVGGDDWDRVRNVIQTSDGGYLLTGISESNASFDKSEDVIGDDDAWIVKLDANGNLEWENTIGGDLREVVQGAVQTDDGGYIIAGWTNSGISGDIDEQILGPSDCWIFKLDSEGAIVWQKLIGGNDHDGVTSINKLSNGNFLIGAVSSSDISGEKTEDSFGETDFWVFEINQEGNIIWQKTIGGNLDDSLYDAVESTNGEILLIGGSISDASGLKTENTIGETGYSDYWVVKLDTDKNILWDNTIGGDFVEAVRGGIATEDGGCLITGHSFSNISGDKSENVIGDNEQSDYWIVKLNSDGEISWENTIGGDKTDNCWSAVQLSDGSYVIGGESNSDIYGDKTEDSDYIDVWLLGIDANGEISWQDTVGGSNSDYLQAHFIVNENNNLIMAAYSSSPVSGDVTDGSNGGFDYWLVEFGNLPLSNSNNNWTDSITLYPNPVTDNLNINANENLTSFKVYNSLGQIMTEQSIFTKKISLSVSNYQAGIYFINLISNEKIETRKFIKF